MISSYQYTDVMIKFYIKFYSYLVHKFVLKSMNILINDCQ